MRGDKPSLIAPPPSVGDVLTSLTADESRIGRVDFSTRLAAEAEAKAEAKAAASEAAEATAPESPAVDAAAAEPPEAAEASEAPETTAVGEEAAEESGADPAGQLTGEVARMAPHDVLTEVGDEPESDRASRDELEEVHEAMADAVDPTLATGPATVVAPVEITAPEPPAPRMPRTVTHEVPHDLVRSVGEVADTVVVRMRQAEAATLQHLAALESEALRRCELLTAQAELDAELIRLHARREAHAIITAARMRAGDGSLDDESTALIEMGDALAHVAETTETALAPKKKRAPRRSEKP